MDDSSASSDSGAAGADVPILAAINIDGKVEGRARLSVRSAERATLPCRRPRADRTALQVRGSQRRIWLGLSEL
jgi:hypothetical protein